MCLRKTFDVRVRVEINGKRETYTVTVEQDDANIYYKVKIALFELLGNDNFKIVYMVGL